MNDRPEYKCDPPGSIRTALDVNVDSGARHCGMCAKTLDGGVTLGQNCPHCHYRLGWFQLLTDVTALGDRVGSEKALKTFIEKRKAREARGGSAFDFFGPSDM